MTSEEVFQGQINDVAAAFEADRHLGFALNVWHYGLQVADKMPTIGAVGDGVTEINCHFARGQLEVVVYADDSIAAFPEEDLEAAVYMVVRGAVPDGKVWDRVRFATNDEEFQDFYRDTTPAAHYNFWFVRRVGRDIQRAGGIDDTIMSVTHRFDLDYFRGLTNDEA
jgi:hypothetical protein